MFALVCPQARAVAFLSAMDPPPPFAALTQARGPMAGPQALSALAYAVVFSDYVNQGDANQACVASASLNESIQALIGQYLVGQALERYQEEERAAIVTVTSSSSSSSTSPPRAEETPTRVHRRLAPRARPPWIPTTRGAARPRPTTHPTSRPARPPSRPTARPDPSESPRPVRPTRARLRY